MVEITTKVPLYLDDPLLNLKNITLQGLNRISDLVRESKGYRNNLILFVFSILLGILSNIFVNKGNWLMVAIMCNLLLIILIIGVNSHNQERKILKQIQISLMDKAKEFEMIPK